MKSMSKTGSKNKQKDCLVIKNDGIGDLVLNAGIIGGLVKEFPGGVDLVTCIENKFIAERIPNLRTVYYFSRDQVRIRYLDVLLKTGKFTIPPRDAGIFEKISQHHYDTAICLRRFIRQSSLITMSVVQADEKFSFFEYPTNASKQQGIELSQGWRHVNADKNIKLESDYYVACLREVIPNFSPEPNDYFKLDNPPKKKHKSLLVGLSGSSSRVKFSVWENLIEVAVALDLEVCLVGSARERRFAHKLEMKHPHNVVNKCDLFSLEELMFVMSKYRYFVGNDTGISHLASTICHKTLVLMGGGTFGRFWNGSKNPTATVVYHSLNCFDCNWDCAFRTQICLDNLEKPELEGVFKKWLNGSKNLPTLIDLNKTAENIPNQHERLQQGYVYSSKDFYDNFKGRIFGIVRKFRQKRQHISIKWATSLATLSFLTLMWYKGSLSVIIEISG